MRRIYLILGPLLFIHPLIFFTLVVLSGCGKSGSSSSPPPPPPPSQKIATIAVNPGSASLTENGFQQFGATARDAQGSPVSGTTFTWSSSDTNIATVDSGSGLAHGMTEGNVTITASAGSVTGSAHLRINLTAVSTIDLFPSTATVAVGQTQQFAAEAKDALGHQIANVLFSWSTSDATIATISTDGLLTGNRPGTVIVTAAAGSVTQQSVSIQIASPGSPSLGTLPVISIEIFPTIVSIDKHTTQRFAGVAKDGSGKQISGVVFQWQTGDPLIASIDPATGSATGLAGGVTTVTSSNGAVTSNAASLTIRLFDDPIHYAVGNTPQSVAAGDFDGDGVIDLATANTDGNNLSILKGLGSGTFSQPPQVLATGALPESIVSGHFVVNNTFDDLAVAVYQDNLLSVFLGSGGGIGPVAGAPLPNAGPMQVITTDFNKDLKNDLASANWTSNSISILMGNGDGTFGVLPDISLGQTPIALTSGDFNGDGSADLAIVLGDGTVGILLGVGDGTFHPLKSIPLGQNPTVLHPISIVSGDWNGDRKIDLAVVNSGDATIRILLGDGTGAFPTAATATLQGGGHPVFIAAGDFNHDGVPDLAIADDARNVVSILLNTGGGVYSPQIDHPAGSKPVSIIVKDFDGDGRDDMAVTNAQTNTLSVFLQIP